MIYLTRIISLVILVCFSTFFSSCISIERTVDEIGNFELSGIMHYATISGGCWQFIGNDGEIYELTGMKVISLLREGLRADLVVRGPLELASVCQVGQVVEILEIIRTYYE